MTTRPVPDAYRPMQKVLHWFVVLGVMFQIAMHEPMVRVTEAMQAGLTPDDGDMPGAMIHATVGSLVLLAVLARLVMRWRFGVPGHAPGTSAMQGKIADIMHWALYAALFGMVITGMLTWNGIAPLGSVHFGINVALFFMILGHAAAAIYNQFVRKDGTLRRMC